MDAADILKDVEAAERVFELVRPEMDALNPAEFTPMNVDVVSAASVALGVAPRVLQYRDRLAALPEFEIRNVDKLVAYATSTWFASINNLAAPDPVGLQALLQECAQLRAKLLLWAEPLVQNGNFDAAAIAKVKDGTGSKDIAGDVVALVGLYRANWGVVDDLCAVTETDLDRGAQIGPVAFAMVSQKEQQRSRSLMEDSQRTRRAWTLLDRAYDQCRRGLTFLLWNEGSVDAVAPALRRNSGPRRRSGITDLDLGVASLPQPRPALPAETRAPIGDGAAPYIAEVE